MPFTAITPASGASVTSQVVTIGTKITGWSTQPDSVIYRLGSGRIERTATYNPSNQKWEIQFDVTTSPAGPGGQPEDPYCNYALAVRIRAEGGNRVEEYAGHYFYAMYWGEEASAATSFTWREANAWDTPFSSFANSSNGDEMEAFYKAGSKPTGSGIGEYFTSISTINGRKWATMRPDLSKLPASSSIEYDQPNEGGIRAQFGTRQLIDKGDYFACAITIMIPVGNAVPKAQEQHANALQIYGPDFNGPNTCETCYNMGTPFALNMSARTRYDRDRPANGKTSGSYITSDQGLLYSTGNKTNPGLAAAVLERYLTPGKPYTIAFEFGVSSDPRYGWGRIFLDEGRGLEAVKQPIPYPGTDDYTKFPFVLQSKYHRTQRIDIQVYGERTTEAGELPELWPNFAYQFGHHKIGPSIAAVDPQLYPVGGGMPDGYTIDRSQPMQFRLGEMVLTAS